jgi:hypothetical protein
VKAFWRLPAAMTDTGLPPPRAEQPATDRAVPALASPARNDRRLELASPVMCDGSCFRTYLDVRRRVEAPSLAVVPTRRGTDLKLTGNN